MFKPLYLSKFGPGPYDSLLGRPVICEAGWEVGKFFREQPNSLTLPNSITGTLRRTYDIDRRVDNGVIRDSCGIPMGTLRPPQPLPPRPLF